MTIQELYDWAKEHNAVNYSIEIQYRDDGGAYYGRDKEVYTIIADAEDANSTEKIVIL